MYNEYYLTDEHYAIAEANGISRKRVQERVNVNGWSIEDAITKPLKRQTSRGKWLAVARANGINVGTFYTRVNNRGWDEERAATEPAHDYVAALVASNKRRRKIPIEAFETARQNGIKDATLVTRLRYGWSLEDAISTPVLSPSEAGRRAVKKRKETGSYRQVKFGRVRRNEQQMERYRKEKDTLTGKMRAQANAKKKRERRNLVQGESL